MQEYQDYYYHNKENYLNYQNPNPPPGYAPYQPYPVYSPYPPAPPRLSPKQMERRLLRSESNKMGFFVLIYFVMMVIVYNVIYLFSSDAIKHSGNPTVMMFLLEAASSISAALLAVVFYRLISRRPFSNNLPKNRVKIGTLIPVIMVGMGAAIIANQLASLFDQNISLFELKNTVEQTTQTQSAAEILLYIFSTAIVPALAEELTFRGVFMNAMRKYGDAFAIVTSSVMFGAMHCNTTQIVFAFVLGLIFAYMDCKANSIIPSIFIHFCNNFFAVVTEIIRANTGFDTTVVNVIHISILLMFCIIGVLSYLYLASKDPDFFRISDKDKTPFYTGSRLTLKEKFTAFFTTAGVIIPLVIFISEMLVFLIPADVRQNILG